METQRTKCFVYNWERNLNSVKCKFICELPENKLQSICFIEPAHTI